MPLDPAKLRQALEAVAGDAAGLEVRILLDEAKDNPDWLKEALKRRLAREPLDRILGRRGFWTLDLKITRSTLSPRPDTETVVELSLEQIAKNRDEALSIADLGTGSGAILLALLVELPHAHGLGRDISAPALKVAEENAIQHGLAQRCRWSRGFWLNGINEQFDVIVSNPPYIPAAHIDTLDPEVKNHDPRLSLDGGPDGLDCYRAIFPKLARALKPNGFAVFEFGQGQAPDVIEIAKKHSFQILEIKSDLGGHARCVAVSPMPSAKRK